MSRLIPFLAVPALVVAVVACSGDGSPSAGNAWAVATPDDTSGGPDEGAIYLDVESPVDDRLIAVTVTPDVAARTELHETGDDSGDAAAMRQVADIELPAGDAVALEPGGLHVMLIALDRPLTAGDTFDATLVFEDAEPIVVEVEVRDAD